MADNAAQSIKDLDERIKSLDKGLQNTMNLSRAIAENSKMLGDVMMQALKKGSDESKEAVKNLKELNKTITDTFGSGKEIKIAIGIEKDRLKKEIAETEGKLKKFTDNTVEIKRNEQNLSGYKEQPAQLGNFEKTYARINQIVNAGKGNAGTLLGKARADEMTKVQKYTKLANEELARQQRIEDTIAKIRERKGKSAKFDGEVKSIQQLNDMLTISKRQLDEYIRTLNSLGSRGRSAASGFGGDGTKTALRNQETNFIKLNKLLNQRREILSRMGKGGTDAQKAEYKALNAEIRNTIGNMRELESKYNGITNKARQGTLYQRLHATNQSISRLNDSLTKTKTSLESMLPNLRRLASAFGVAFSVQGLVNFGRKLVETRGEFEMQFVAMKQIIGDVDAATKIWNQTMQQALQSPFKAMQLVDYTKKLAAYRIETDKLFDTTKRLADVSAGLGVDMGRLILAYGQVKAANFLRASEIRQFTEAGVNIVGQLSEYFTQLEGRAVSTADVMERVTKRMVLFEDVEEIFKRMTDEGGTFYNMQEVQADTVRGQINKLHDAYDQMLNTIGQANQGTIRNLIESANSLVRNWRDVASFLMKNVNAFVILLPLIATYRKGAKLAASETFTWTRAMRQIGFELTFARNGMKKFSISTAAGTAAVYMFKGAMEILKTTFRTFVPFLAIEGLMLLVTKMQAADRAANQLTKDLDEVGKRNAQSLQDNIDGFTNLVERLKRATEGSQDYLDIRNKIQSQYGEYLDNLEAEQITVENLANSYDRVVERMREKSRQHIMEEGLQEITNAYGDAIVKFQKNITGFKFTSGLQVSDKEAADIAKKMYELYAKDESYRGMQNPVGLLKDALKQYYGESSVKGLNYAQLSIGNALYKSIETRYNKQIELETKANSLTRATANTHQEYLDQLALEEEHQENINKIQQKVQSKEKTEYELQLEKIRYDEKRLELQAKYEKKSSEWLDKEKKKLKENYDAFLKSYNARVEAYVGSVYGKNWREVDNEKAFMDYNAMVATQSRIAQGQSRWEESILNDKKVTEENIKRLKEEQATQTAKDAEASKHLNDELTKENHRLAIIKKQMELLGLHEKDKSKGSGSANNSIYGDRIRLLQDMLQKYRQAAKEAYGFAKAEEKTGQSFEDAWNSIMPVGYGELEVPTSYAALAEMLQRLEAFTPQFDKNGKLSKMMADLKKAIADALSNVDLEMSVRIREDFGRQMEETFGNYELTLELQKINLPSDAAKDILGFDYTSLNSVLERVRKFRNDLENVVVGKDEKGNDIIENHFDKDDQQAYANWMKKIEDQLFNIRKERAKQYTKYLEQELSERAKLEMQYVKDTAFVEANFKGEQKDAIKQNLQINYEQALKEFEWKSFKESDFYVEMMQDLTSMPSEYLDLMMQKLNEWAAKADVLSPRALKEVLRAREKVMAAQVALSPIRAIGQSLGVIRGFQGSGRTDAQGNAISKNIKESREQMQGIIVAREQEIQKIKEKLALEEQLAGKIKAQEELQESLNQLTNKGVEGLQMTADVAQDLANIERASSTYGVILTGLLAGGVVEQAEGENDADFQTRKRQYEDEVRELRAIIDLLNQLRERRVAASTAGVDPTQDYSSAKMASIKRITDLRKQLTEAEREQAKDQGIMTEGYKAWNEAVHGLANNIKDVTVKAKEMGNQLYDTLEILGVETDEVSAAWKEFGNSMSDVITSAIEMIPALVTGFTSAGVAINKAMGVIGLIALAIQAVLTLIQGLSKIHDADLAREIRKQQEYIDDLRDSYARLEKQIEKTWSSVSYMQTYEQQVQNIREQIDAMEAQMRAEEAKKNTDDNAVRQYQRDIQDAYDQLEELEQKSIEVFGGIGEEGYRSAAEGFVDAWKSAFLETGDGLQGLQDHFNEFLQDWFTKQATMRIAGAMLEDTFKQIDQAVNKNGDGGVAVTAQELAAIRDRFAAVAPELSAALEQLAGMWDLQGEGSLSGLAAGIQGMTEEQANILEAYWNSVRMYTASIDVNVARIASVITSGGVGENFVGGRSNEIEVGVSMGDMKTSINRLATTLLDNNESTNPMLQQLTIIAHTTNSINTLLQSVVRSGHSLGGYGLKVFPN